MSVNTTEKLSYLDTSLPLAERVKDLISRLTLEEKVAMMNHPAQGVPRLNIPGYNYWSEALHGVARNGRATVFPQAIAMAATWDKDLILKVATAISDEGRAKYHAALKRNGYTDQYQGLTFWSPNVNIFRDPRWGRIAEGAGDALDRGEELHAVAPGDDCSGAGLFRLSGRRRRDALLPGRETRGHAVGAHTDALGAV